MDAYGYRLLLTAVIAVLANPIALPQAEELLSRCVRDGTPLQLDCPVVGFEEGDYVQWTGQNFDYEVDYDFDDGGRRISGTASWDGDPAGYNVDEVSCDYQASQYYHAAIIVTDSQNPVLPIITPSLQKGTGDTLVLMWRNPISTFREVDEVYYNYTIVVNVTNGYQLTRSLDVESHIRVTHMSINLTGHECKHVEIRVSLPGNCEDKIISGSLLITPQHFQDDTTSQILFSENGDPEQVQIHFTPPELCPSQSVSYILTFDDGIEVWSTLPETIHDSTQPVRVIVRIEDKLRRDENYTLNVTIITDYANVSSSTDFSTHSLLRLAPTNLRVRENNRSVVELAWSNPDFLAPSFSYYISFHIFNSGRAIEPIEKSFRREDSPLISVDLNGFECEQIQVTVAVLGKEEKAQSRNITLPSYSTTFVKEIHIETSLYNNSIIREAEISFIPPHVCEFQEASYMLFISEGTRMWSTSDARVPIKDSSEHVVVELESGFVINTEYTATITVFTEYANMSSSDSFIFETTTSGPALTDALSNSEKPPEGISSALVGGVVGGVVFLLLVVLLCGFGTGMIAVYLLRKKKEEKQRQIKDSVGRCMVTNPIYGSNDGFYEELPEHPHSTNHSTLNTIATSLSPSTPLPPNIPPPRKAAPDELALELPESEKEALESKLNGVPPSSSHDAISLSSSLRYNETEDCYTVMSPAGTVKMLPRNRHSVGSLPAGGTPWPLGGPL